MTWEENVREWTTEISTTEGRPCVNRSGSYGSTASDYPASYRVYAYANNFNDNIGLRITLYV